MESAYEKLGDVLQHVPMQPPSFPVISNVTGEEVRTPVEIRRTLQDQVTGTVRWFDCMERLAGAWVRFLRGIRTRRGAGRLIAAHSQRRRCDVGC